MDRGAVLGPLVVLTWANTVLMTLEAVQLYTYFKQYRRSIGLHCLVLVCFVLDLASSFGNWISIYLLTVTHWGEEGFALTQNVAMYCLFATGIVSFNVQTFLILRYYSLSKRLFNSIILCFIAVVAAGGALATASAIAIHNSYAERGRLVVPGLTWLAATTVVDWAIAGALVWELHKLRAGARVGSTDGIIQRLISAVISTGALPSTVATISLINFVTNPLTNVATGFALCLGRIYTLTMLYNINYVYGPNFLRPDTSPDGSGSTGDVNVQLTTDVFANLSIPSGSDIARYPSSSRCSALEEARSQLPDSSWGDSRGGRG